MSEKRKKALVIYLAALFGMAFLIVSISLGIQLKKNTLNATTAEKVVALQEEVQRLESENRQLKGEKQELENQLSEILEGFEHLEETAYAATNRINQLERIQELYEYVTDYDQARLAEDADAQSQYLKYLEEAQEEAKTLDEKLYDRIQIILEENVTKEEKE